MPNLGAAVGESATAYYYPPFLSAAQRSVVEYVVAALGRSWKVDSESLLDLATAVAGSGPAYLCWLGEQVEKVARENGFSEHDAHAIVLQTFKGAVAYLETSDETFASLRTRVTSPNGTTAAAIATLDSVSADDVVQHAVEAACRRAKELGKLVS
jgi:pyrroline-5-carboxylate reductase